MKALKFASALTALCAAFLVNSASAAPIQVSGYYAVPIQGFLRQPISVNGRVDCSGYLFVVPSTNGNPAISSLGAAILANSATSNASISATIDPNKQNFSCSLIVPYFFNAFDSATQSLYLVYTVKLSDPNTFNFSVSPPQQIIGTGIRSTRQTSIVSPTPTGIGQFQTITAPGGAFIIYM